MSSQYPNGQLNDNDEGELRMVAYVEKGAVVLNFGKPIAWVGFPPEIARDLAKLLMDKADEAEQSRQVN